MATQQCTVRLQKELKALLKEPLPGLRALPHPSNLLEWHYVLQGSFDSDYAGGWFHGKIIFPPKYPFAPPSIIMLTPSGRFEAGSKICLSLSDFHPESWNPLWGVGHILLGLQSFFYENVSTTGALHGVTAAEKKRLARQSLAFNVKNSTFRKLFPELVEKHAQELASAATASPAITSTTGGIGGNENKHQQRPAQQQQLGDENEEGGYQAGWPLKFTEVLFGIAIVVVGIGLSTLLVSNTDMSGALD